jgi:glycerophosphoryl diester phosphodiesterase
LLPLLILAACAPEESGETPTRAETAGWRIAPEGDLNAFFDCLAAEGIALVAAHRGGPAPGYPENAIETFERTLSLAPAFIEADVAQAADGVLFLLHDETLDRTTSGKGEASALTFDEIAALRLEDGQGNETTFAPPRFADALAWADGRTILEVDIKPSAKYEDVAAEITAQNAEGRVLIIARTLAQAQKLRALLPETMISLDLNSMSDLNRAVAGGVPAEALLGFTGTEAPRPRLFDILGERGVEVVFGALGRDDSIDAAIAASGDDNQYAEIASLGADIIATDRPLQAQAALAAAGKGARDGVCGISRQGG